MQVNALRNPVLPEDRPDPGVVRTRDGYVCTTTSGDARDSFPLFTSSDLESWTPQGSIFPEGTQPEWTDGDFWAPEIHRVGKSYVAYYTARDHTGRLCIGAARAQDPLGPYTDLGRPLVREDEVGVIDANYFRDDDGRHYLLWKEDGNDNGRPTPINIRELTRDGMGLRGETTELITNDLPWEGNLVEAPWMVKRDGQYYLFYSANAFYDERYCVGVARSDSPTGEFEKLPEPILHSDEEWAGPGHGSLVVDPEGNDAFVYHAWERGNEENGRVLMRDEVHWRDGWPIIHDGTPS